MASSRQFRRRSAANSVTESSAPIPVVRDRSADDSAVTLVGGGGRARAIALIAISFGVVNSGAFWLAGVPFRYGNAESRQAVVDNDGLVVDASRLDFGQVWLTDSLQWTLPIRNESTAELHIERFASSCNCTKVEPQRFVLMPGAAASVHLTMNFMSKRVILGDEFLSRVGISLQPHVKRGDQVRVLPGWVIRGAIRCPIKLDDTAINFGEIVRGSPASVRRAVITSQAAQSIKSVTCECDPSHATCTMKALDRLRFELTVKLDDDFRAGRFEFPILLRAVHSDGRVFAQIPVYVVGRMLEDVFAKPATVFLEPRKGRGLGGVVVVATRSGRPIERLEVIAPNEPLHFVSSGPDKNGDWRIRVELEDRDRAFRYTIVKYNAQVAEERLSIEESFHVVRANSPPSQRSAAPPALQFRTAQGVDN